MTEILQENPQDPFATAFEEIDQLKNTQNENISDNQKTHEEFDKQNSQEEDKKTNEESETEEKINLENESKIKKETNWSLKRKLYQANIRHKELEAENKKLAENLNKVLDAGSYHYSKNVQSELELAKEELINAIKTGDEKAFINAQLKLNEKQIALSKQQEWEQQQQFSGNTEENNIKEPLISQSEAEEMLYDWVNSKHPYLNPNSNMYSKDLVNSVGLYMEGLNTELQKQGKENLIFSPDYFDVLDDYITGFKNSRKTSNIKTYPPANNVGRVATPVNTKSSEDKLSNEEKEIADMFGISHEAYRKEKNNQKNK